MNEYFKLLLTANKKIALLEAKLQSAQADKLDAIAKERKRWGREDLEALEIRDLEQRLNTATKICNRIEGLSSAKDIRVRADKIQSEYYCELRKLKGIYL
tara:strand:+ start:1006 stop:1305 length:300 start_codon:yes stop_codon:yes gene_type:complete